MRYSTQLSFLARKYGHIKGADMLMDAGFTAIDITIHGRYDSPDTVILKTPIYSDEYESFARELRERAEARGAVYNQAHAPFPSETKIELLPRAIEFAGLLGVKTIVVHPSLALEYYHNEEATYEHNMEFYSSLVPYAKDAGVKIGIENTYRLHKVTNRICDTAGSSTEELCRYYDTLKDTGVFTICLDVGHAALCGREPADVIRDLGHERLGALHMHDVDYIDDLHHLPGTSKLKFTEICRALGEIDYTGDVTLEADRFYSGFDEDFYPEAAKFMAKTAKHLAELVDSYRNNK